MKIICIYSNIFRRLVMFVMPIVMLAVYGCKKEETRCGKEGRYEGIFYSSMHLSNPNFGPPIDTTFSGAYEVSIPLRQITFLNLADSSKTYATHSYSCVYTIKKDFYETVEFEFSGDSLWFKRTYQYNGGGGSSTFRGKRI